MIELEPPERTERSRVKTRDERYECSLPGQIKRSVDPIVASGLCLGDDLDSDLAAGREGTDHEGIHTHVRLLARSRRPVELEPTRERSSFADVDGRLLA